MMQRVTIYTTAFNLAQTYPARHVEKLLEALRSGTWVELVDKETTYWINPALVCALVITDVDE